MQQENISNVDVDVQLSPKTVKYLDGLAQSTNELFAKAVEYKQLMDNAKTSLAREIYGKKIRKLVNEIDANMALFSMLEERANRASSSDGTQENENVV